MFSSYFGKKEDKCDGSLAYSSSPSLGGEVHEGLTVAVNVNQDVMYAGYTLSAIGSRLVEILLSKPCTKEEKEEIKGLFGQINENTSLINKCYAKSYYEFGVEDEEESEEDESES